MNLMPRTELVDLLCLSSLCLVIAIVLWLFLMVSWVGLQYVIVVFPDQTHLFFLHIWSNFGRGTLLVFLSNK